MNLIAYAVLTFILMSTGKRVFGQCVLDRNEYNKYPWLLRMVAGKSIRCHGVLITPKYMVSAYQPIKALLRNQKALAKLNITAQVYGPNGEIQCSVSRKARRLAPTVYQNSIANVVLGIIEKAFEVTLNNPYLYPDIKHYDSKMFDDKFADIIDFECCVIPVFDSMTAENPKIVEHKVTYLKGPTDEYWRKALCNDSPECLKKAKDRNFFAYDPSVANGNTFWYQGAAIVCGGNPLAIVEAHFTDPATATRITMLEHIKNLANYFRDYALKEWPRGALPNTTQEDSKKGGEEAKKGDKTKRRKIRV